MKKLCIFATFMLAILAFTMPLFAAFESSTVNGDIIVTDTETGLIWQNYVTNKKWKEALSYCENLTYAGYSDWRLPNKNELASLVNYEKYKPASDFPDMPSEFFWSSSVPSDNSDDAWQVDFNNGYVDFDGGSVSDSSKSLSLTVRCVRNSSHSDSKKTATKSTNSKNKKEAAKTEKLQWSKKAPKTMEWDDAINYCKNLNEGGHKDWRLPNINELRTLIQNCPATQTGGECKVTDSCLSYSDCRNSACDGCGSDSSGRYSKLGDTDWFWSSSVRSDDSDNAWHVLFFNGGVSHSYKRHNRYVRCVR